MYISRIKIANIRSIKSLEFDFQAIDKPGWHVIIGDNGSGKSTLVRSIALALFGPQEAAALRQNWNDWLRWDESVGTITLYVKQDPKVDMQSIRGANPVKLWVGAGINFKRVSGDLSKKDRVVISPEVFEQMSGAEDYLWGSGKGWFSASFGPFRRFSGGDKDLIKINYTNPKVAAHLSAFGEDVALTEALEWIVQLNYKRLEGRPEGKQLEYIKLLINEGGLLPHNTTIDSVTSDGVFFKDGNGAIIDVNQMSDGYRSVLSLTFELIRQMILAYGSQTVFKAIAQGKPVIHVPGVVIIDEIDAHLHPTWQVRIGQWFTKYFPKIQFIVTTHSPLICRAAENGSVWRLSAPGQDKPSGQITGNELKRLVYGNVLDAYGTEVFGQDVTRSENAHALLDRMAKLNKKSVFGKITSEESKELQELRAILPTDSF